MSAINALIAQGGTNVASPTQRYLETKQMMNQERRNALAETQAKQQMASTSQQMGVTAQQQQTAMTEEKIKGLATFGQVLRQAPPEQRKQVFESMRNQTQRFGLEQIPPNVTYEQVAPAIEAAYTRVYGQDKGTFTNALDDSGQVVPAYTDEQGLMRNPVTKQPEPSWTKAPGRQVTATTEGFGADYEGKTKRDKDREAAVAERENVLTVAGQITNIKDTIANAQDYVGGVSGTVIQAVNSASEQWRQIHGGVDPVMTDGVIDPKKLKDGTGRLNKENLDWIRRVAMSGSAVDSAVLELAFTHAKLLNNSGKISDADVRFAREIIEGGGDIAIKQQKLDGMLDRAHIGYEAKREARKGLKSYEYWTEIPKEQLYGKYAPSTLTGGTGGGGDAEIDALTNDLMQGFE